MQQNLQNKKGLVENVFNQVYNKYDLMNDFMSMGVHRYWKKSLINMMNPRVNRKLIDVACGTGDVGKLFLDSTNKEAEITCIDPNKGMIGQGKQKLSEYKLKSEYKTSGANDLPTITIRESESNKVVVYFRSRVENKIDKNGVPYLYYRNYIEKGQFLTELIGQSALNNNVTSS